MVLASMFGACWRIHVDDKGMRIFQLRKRVIARDEISALRVVRRDDRSYVPLSRSSENEPVQSLVLVLSDGRSESLMGTASRSRSATNRLVRARLEMLDLLKMPTE
jgi:hypothetical protein